MRGKGICVKDRRDAVGITPACAGKTCISSAVSALLPDHPRVCGENSTRFPTPYSPRGSPPRMRGKHKDFAQKVEGVGITPAHAGKTPASRGAPGLSQDHPRACGENTRGFTRLPPSQESPPRMRGKLRHRREQNREAGITPAHAGKTSITTLRLLCRRDHPRACGENRSTSAPMRVW